MLKKNASAPFDDCWTLATRPCCVSWGETERLPMRRNDSENFGYWDLFLGVGRFSVPAIQLFVLGGSQTGAL